MDRRLQPTVRLRCASLPDHRNNLDDPAAIPYLAAEPASSQRRVEVLSGLKIGIAWQGNPKHERDFRRSFPLARMAPLASVPGVQLISLQSGFGEEQVSAFAGSWPLRDLRAQLDASAGPFLESAAIIENLDLVIACDSAIAHLAGALGAPVWVALPFCRLLVSTVVTHPIRPRDYSARQLGD